MHVHDLQPFRMSSWNISHRINRISFGKEFPGVINPLDGVEKTTGTTPTSLSLSLGPIPAIHRRAGDQCVDSLSP